MEIVLLETVLVGDPLYLFLNPLKNSLFEWACSEGLPSYLSRVSGESSSVQVKLGIFLGEKVFFFHNNINGENLLQKKHN